MKSKQLVAMFALALAGCSSSKPKPEASKPPELEIEVGGYYGGRVTLYADGREVGKSDGGLVVRLPAQPRPRLTATVESRCGTWDATVSVKDKYDPSGNPTQARLTTQVAELTLPEGLGPSLTNVELWVDNRGRPEGRLRAYGEERVIAADEATHFQLRYELCPAMREVYLDGKLVGMLPEVIPDERRDGLDDPWDVKYSHDLLLDTSGNGCYRYTLYCYKKKGYEWCEGPQSRSYRGKHLHRLPGKIDFFFKAVPKEIRAWGGVGSASRVGLNDCRAR